MYQNDSNFSPMKKNILRLLAWTVFAIGAVMPSFAADYAGLTLVEGPFYIRNGHSQNEYLYASGNYVYGNGTYTPQNGTDTDYLWNIWTDGNLYYIENVGTTLFMNTEHFGDYINNNGNNNSLEVKSWTGDQTNYFAFTLPGYTPGNRADGETVTTQIREQRGTYGDRPLHNGVDIGTFNASSATNKVYFTDNDYGWGTKNWVFVKSSATFALSAETGCWNAALNGRTGGADVKLSWNRAGNYNITGDLGNISVSNTESSHTFRSVAAGTYNVTITDASDASKTASTTVTVNNSLTACPKQTLKITASACWDKTTNDGLLTFSWNDVGLPSYRLQRMNHAGGGSVISEVTVNGETSYTFEHLASGTYYYRVIDAAGNEDVVNNSNIISIPVSSTFCVSCTPERITLSLNQPLCVGGSGTIASARVYPGSANSNVTWSISGSGATINAASGALSATAAGTVIVTATSTIDPTISASMSVPIRAAGNCDVTDTKTSDGITLSIAGDDIASCLGETKTFNLTTSGTLSGGKYVWYVYDSNVYSWKKESEVSDYKNPITNVGGTYTVMADNRRHYVQYEADNGTVLAQSNEVTLRAAPCCSVDESGNTTGEDMYSQSFDSQNLGEISVGDYQYTTSSAVNDGYYALLKTVGGAFSGWNQTVNEHTGNNGHMLVINAYNGGNAPHRITLPNGKEATLAFQTDVDSPCENATVDFSTWFTNICRSGGSDCGEPIQLTYTVQGRIKNTDQWEEVDVSALNSDEIPSSTSAQWQKTNTSFSTQEYETLRVSIYARLGATDAGNDFAIDDISIKSCAPQVYLYADPEKYQTDVAMCEDKIVSLTPKSPIDLTELYNPLYYMLQKFNPATNSWEPVTYTVGGQAVTDENGITNPHTNPIPVFEVNTADLAAGEHEYRVLAGNSYDAVRVLGNGGTPTAVNCQLYTATNVSKVIKSTLSVTEDKSMSVCEGSEVDLNVSATTPWGTLKEWKWLDGGKESTTVLCTSAAPADACSINGTNATYSTIAEGSGTKQYTFVATDQYNCTKTTTFSVTPSTPKYSFTQDKEICNGESAVLRMDFVDSEAPYTFVFSDGTNNENITTSSNPWTRTVTPTSTTTYSVRSVRDKNCGMQEDN